MRPLSITLAAILLGATAASAQTTTYHVTRRATVGGDGGWDYLTVDTSANRLFVSRGTHVMVVDLASDSVIGDIPNTPGVHGIAIAPELGRGFTSNGRDSTVTIFDLKTLAPIARVNVGGRNPDAILYDPATRRVFTFNGGSADASAIDAATGKLLGTVALGGKPEAAVADGTGRIFVNVEDKGEVASFDGRALTVEKRWSIAPCQEPSGLAFDRAHARLFSVCDGVMAVSDAGAGRLVTTVAIGRGPDGAAFDPASGLAFSTNGEGTLSVVHEDAPDRYTVLGNVPTDRGARTIALDPRSHRIYTITAHFGETPAPTADRPRPRPPMVPGSFMVLTIAP